MIVFLIQGGKYENKIALKLWANPKTYTVYVKMDPNEKKPYCSSDYTTPTIKKNLLREIEVDASSEFWPDVLDAIEAYKKQKLKAI